MKRFWMSLIVVSSLCPGALAQSGDAPPAKPASADEPAADAAKEDAPSKPGKSEATEERARTSAADPFAALLVGAVLEPVNGVVTGLSREDGVEVRRWVFGRTRAIDRWRGMAEDETLTGVLEFRSGASASASIELFEGATLFIDRLSRLRVSRATTGSEADAPTRVVVELRRGKLVVMPTNADKKTNRTAEPVIVITPHGEYPVTGVTEFVVSLAQTQSRATTEPAPIPKMPPKPVKPAAKEPEAKDSEKDEPRPESEAAPKSMEEPKPGGW